MTKRFARIRQSAAVRKGIFVLAFLAVIAPAVGLLVVQYKSFRNLRPKNWDVVEKEMHGRLFQLKGRLEGRLVSSFTGLFLSMKFLQKQDGLRDAERIRSAFVGIRGGHPEIGRIFIYRTSLFGSPPVQTERFFIGDEAGFRVVDLKGTYPASILTMPSAPSAEAAADEDLILSTFAALNRGPIRPFHPPLLTAQSPREEAYGEMHFWQGDCPKCSAERKGDLNYAVAPIPTDSPSDRCVVGLTFKSDFLRRNIFQEMERDAQQASFDRGDVADFVVELTESGTGLDTIYGPGFYQQKTSLAPMFPRWTLVAGASRSLAFDEASRKYFLQAFTLSILTVVFLAAGLLIAIRVMMREAKLIREKSDFVSNVSHELKTPLALIRMFAETLELGRVKDRTRAQEYYRIIVAESRRLTQLINNILDFAAIESGQRKYDFVACDPAEIVVEVVENYRAALVNAGFALTVDVTDRAPTANVDREAFAQVIVNLLENAVKYSDAVKEIAVRVYEDDGGVTFEVADRGIGIPYDEQEKIFEKFHRVGNSLVHNVKGSGLGLSLVKEIVAAHGGAVRVASAPGVGSRFTVRLPTLRRTGEHATSA
jgi:signal transduction histidine kinase